MKKKSRSKAETGGPTPSQRIDARIEELGDWRGKTLALPYRGGAIALFNVHRVQRVTGRITVVQGAESRVPSYGDFTVTVNGGETTSPIGSSGAFYFEDLPAGTHSAVIRDANGRECGFTVTVPASDAGVVNIGTLRCEARAR